MDELEIRAGLPPELRVLLDACPRAGWEAHQNFDGLVRFWLERHGMFRAITERLLSGVEGGIDGRSDPARLKREVARYATLLLRELHGHHEIEDHHYFPRLVGIDARLSRGFALLDRDHHALDGHMAALARDTDGYLRAEAGAEGAEAGALHARLALFGGFLERHLLDEEDLVVPVILTHAPPL